MVRKETLPAGMEYSVLTGVPATSNQKTEALFTSLKNALFYLLQIRDFN